MKKIYYFMAVMLLLLFCSIYYLIIHEKTEIPEIALIKSFESCGADIVSSEMYFWGKLNSNYKNFEDIKVLANKISNDLGIENDEAFSKIISENDNIQRIEISGIDKKKSHICIKTQLLNGKEQEKERSISISVTDDLTVKVLQDKRVEIKKVLSRFNVKTKVNTCVTGSYKGKLNEEQMNEVCKKVFLTASAKKVEGMRDGNLISVSAYTPLIEDSILVNEKNVNLNLALRYNSYEDKTYIWLATPVISAEY